MSDDNSSQTTTGTLIFSTPTDTQPEGNNFNAVLEALNTPSNSFGTPYTTPSIPHEDKVYADGNVMDLPKLPQAGSESQVVQTELITPNQTTHGNENAQVTLLEQPQARPSITTADGLVSQLSQISSQYDIEMETRMNSKTLSPSSEHTQVQINQIKEMLQGFAEEEARNPVTRTHMLGVAQYSVSKEKSS
jgi:hypothetical protein